MKNYMKPDISFFELTLSTSISSGCELKSNNQPLMCPVEIPGQGGLTVFPSDSCDAYVPGYEDQLCYHVPNPTLNVFES